MKTEGKTSEGSKRVISYNPLWKKLIDLKLTKMDLVNRVGLSKATVAKMGKDEYVALDVIVRICNALNCEIYDVIELHQVTTDA